MLIHGHILNIKRNGKTFFIEKLISRLPGQNFFFSDKLYFYLIKDNKDILLYASTFLSETDGHFYVKKVGNLTEASALINTYYDGYSVLYKGKELCIKRV